MYYTVGHARSCLIETYMPLVRTAFENEWPLSSVKGIINTSGMLPAVGKKSSKIATCESLAILLAVDRD